MIGSYRAATNPSPFPPAPPAGGAGGKGERGARRVAVAANHRPTGASPVEASSHSTPGLRKCVTAPKAGGILLKDGFPRTPSKSFH